MKMIRCKAISKSTGKQCRLNVVIGGYCVYHFKKKEIRTDVTRAYIGVVLIFCLMAFGGLR